MARPKKCRICGYRFHDNEDICPECFTARDDDISCEQFSETDHTHSSGFSTAEDSDIYDEFKERDFIDEQRSDEARDPIPSATYGGKQGTPPPTYAQQSYMSEGYRNTQPSGYSGGQSRQDKLNALRNNQYNSGTTNGSLKYYQPPQNGNNVFYTKKGANQKSNKALAVVLLIIFLIIFFIPFIEGISSAIGRSTNKNRNSADDITVSIELPEMPELSIPDIKIPDVSDIDPRQAVFKGSGYELRARFIELYKPIKAAEALNYFSEEELSTVKTAKDYVPEGYRVIVMDLRSVSDNADNNNEAAPEIVPIGCYLDTYDSADHILCSSYMLDEYMQIMNDQRTDIESVMFIISTDFNEFKLHVLIKENKDAVDKVIDIRRWNITEPSDDRDEINGSDNDTAASSSKDVFV